MADAQAFDDLDTVSSQKTTTSLAWIMRFLCPTSPNKYKNKFYYHASHKLNDGLSIILRNRTVELNFSFKLPVEFKNS